MGRRAGDVEGERQGTGGAGDQRPAGRLGDHAGVPGVPAAERAERAEPAVLLADHQVQGQPAAQPDPRLADRPDGGEVRHHAGLHVARAAGVDPPVPQRRLEGGRAPVSEISGRDDVHVTLQHERRHGGLARVGAHEPPGLRPGGLRAREPGRGGQLGEVHRPQVDVQAEGVHVLGQEVLHVALGVAAADARDGEQVDQRGHDRGTVDRGEGALLGAGQVGHRAFSSSGEQWDSEKRRAEQRWPGIANRGASTLVSCVHTAETQRSGVPDLDDLNHRILRVLLRDGRSTYAEIGSEVGLSVSAAKRRVDRLVREGAIRGFTAVVEPQAMGWEIEAVVQLYTNGTVPFETMREDLEHVTEIVEAFTVAGAADAMVRVVAGDVPHLERVISRLRGLSYVQQTDTTMLLSVLVRRPNVPQTVP
jgi:DNA-binding Lrp family transcriptional regulator